MHHCLEKILKFHTFKLCLTWETLILLVRMASTYVWLNVVCFFRKSLTIVSFLSIFLRLVAEKIHQINEIKNQRSSNLLVIQKGCCKLMKLSICSQVSQIVLTFKTSSKLDYETYPKLSSSTFSVIQIYLNRTKCLFSLLKRSEMRIPHWNYAAGLWGNFSRKQKWMSLSFQKW